MPAPTEMNPRIGDALERVWNGDIQGAHADLQDCLATHSGALTAVDQAVIDAASAVIGIYAGKYEDGLARALTALTVLANAGVDEKLDWLYAAIGYTLGTLGDPERGLEWAGRALAATESRPISHGRRKALGTQAALLDQLNDFDGAMVPLLEGLGVAEALQAPGAIAISYVNIAATRVNQVRALDSLVSADERSRLAQEAFDSAERALGINVDHGPVQTELGAACYRGEALTLLGRPAEAIESLTDALPRARDNAHRRAELLLALASAHEAADQLAGAREYLNEAEQFCRQQGLELLLLRVFAQSVELEIKAGDPQAALDSSRRHTAFLEEHYRHRLSAVARSAELFAEAERLRREAESLRTQSKNWEDAALRDTLTNTYNRRGLALRSNELLANGRTLSLAAFDADHFKQVNDRFGHAIGDEVLKSLPRIIETQTRSGDVLARIGGEEFILLLADTGIDTARQICERIRGAIEAFDWENVAAGLRVTSSIGLAERTDKEALDAVIARADGALYDAKHGGRNRVCVNLLL